MERKELMSFTMSLAGALEILKNNLLLKSDLKDYEFNSWANDIPNNFVEQKDAIRLTFKKKA